MKISQPDSASFKVTDHLLVDTEDEEDAPVQII